MSSTKRRLDEIKSVIAKSNSERKNEILQYVNRLGFLIEPKKLKKLEKRLNKIEASLNCLVHYLVEKPLEEQSKINAKIQEKEEIIFQRFDSLLPDSILINQWVDFEIMREYFSDFSFVKTKEYLEWYCAKKGHKIEFQKKRIEIGKAEKHQPAKCEARLHFMIST